MKDALAKDRLIVALDVETRDEALGLVDDLDGLVSFFKIGIPLFMSGGLEDLLKQLREKDVFVDLKMPDDIGETIRRIIALSSSLGIKFLTLSTQVHVTTIRAAREARGANEYPKLLSIPLLSSLDGQDLSMIYGHPPDHLDSFIVDRAKHILGAGCDGLIASGVSIGQLRRNHPDVLIVSPGIRPEGSSPDDHKRSASPFDAIAMGANYLVVGRPVLRAPDRGSRRRIAQTIIDEIDRALSTEGGRPSPGDHRVSERGAVRYSDRPSPLYAKES